MKEKNSPTKVKEIKEIQEKKDRQGGGGGWWLCLVTKGIDSSPSSVAMATCLAFLMEILWLSNRRRWYTIEDSIEY